MRGPGGVEVEDWPYQRAFPVSLDRDEPPFARYDSHSGLLLPPLPRDQTIPREPQNWVPHAIVLTSETLNRIGERPQVYARDGRVIYLSPQRVDRWSEWWDRVRDRFDPPSWEPDEFPPWASAYFAPFEEEDEEDEEEDEEDEEEESPRAAYEGRGIPPEARVVSEASGGETVDPYHPTRLLRIHPSARPARETVSEICGTSEEPIAGSLRIGQAADLIRRGKRVIRSFDQAIDQTIRLATRKPTRQRVTRAMIGGASLGVVVSAVSGSLLLAGTLVGARPKRRLPAVYRLAGTAAVFAAIGWATVAISLRRGARA